MKLLCTAVKPSTCFQSIKQTVWYSHAWFDYDALPIPKLPPSYSIYLGFAESLLEPVTFLWGERPSNYHPDQGLNPSMCWPLSLCISWKNNWLEGRWHSPLEGRGWKSKLKTFLVFFWERNFMRCSLSCFWTYSLLSIGNYCKHSTKTDNFILGDRCPVNWMAKTECSAFCSVPTMYTEKEGQPMSLPIQLDELCFSKKAQLASDH